MTTNMGPAKGHQAQLSLLAWIDAGVSVLIGVGLGFWLWLEQHRSSLH